MNSVNIIGNLTRDPEVRYTSGGSPVVSFGLAWNGRRQVNGEWVDDPNYFDVTGFGEKWEKLAQYISKGSKVGISGRLDWSSWETEGVRRSKVQIVAFDLTFCNTKSDSDGGNTRPADDSIPSTAFTPASPSPEDDDIPF